MNGQYDQAESLRRLLAAEHRRACSFAFLGEHGSGVSTIIAEFASVLAQQDQRVMILDSQPDMAIAQRCRSKNPRHLEHIIDMHGSLDDTIFTLPSGAEVMNIHIRPYVLAHLHGAVSHRIEQEFHHRLRDIQWVLIDPPQVKIDPAFAAIADHLLLVLTPEQHALTGAYANIKLLAEHFGRRAFNVLINRANSLESAQQYFRRLASAATEHLNVSLRWVGFIPEDYHIRRAQVMKNLVSMSFPKSEAALACQQLACALPLWAGTDFGDGQQLFSRLLETMRHLHEPSLEM